MAPSGILTASLCRFYSQKLQGIFNFLSKLVFTLNATMPASRKVWDVISDRKVSYFLPPTSSTLFVNLRSPLFTQTVLLLLASPVDITSIGGRGFRTPSYSGHSDCDPSFGRSCLSSQKSRQSASYTGIAAPLL